MSPDLPWLALVNSFFGLSILVHASCYLRARVFAPTDPLCWGYAAIAAGGLGITVLPLYGYAHPEPLEVMVNAGMALVAWGHWAPRRPRPLVERRRGAGRRCTDVGV